MISSQLSSQLFGKDITWEILIDRNPTTIWRRTAPKELKIIALSNCVHVYLPKSEKMKGISTFISFWDYIDKFMMKSAFKSQRLSVTKITDRIYTSTSSQGKDGGIHTVNLSRWGANCSCMLFKCLKNRIIRELPYYRSLLKESRYFAGQIVCHHIDAVLEKNGFFTMRDYLESS
jgi:hypothetical protein